MTTDRVPDLEHLRSLLQCAIELEHSTLPPYFYALYSLRRDVNLAATEVLDSVFVEEMLHLTLVANVLNAVGGSPRLDDPTLLPGYPRGLPHGDPAFSMSLLPFGSEALEQFMRVERPATTGAPEQADRYETIGQFYAAVRHCLIDACTRLGHDSVFCGDPRRQVDDSFSYGGSGRLFAVDGLDSALAALDEIVEQGEGSSDREVWDGDHEMFHPERDEVAHYYRFRELVDGRRYRPGDTPQSGPTGDALRVDFSSEGARPLVRDPQVALHRPGHPIRAAQESFNSSYCGLLNSLERALNGEPAMLDDAVGVMYELKDRAMVLMEMPMDDNSFAGPTFEYVPPSERDGVRSTGQE